MNDIEIIKVVSFELIREKQEKKIIEAQTKEAAVNDNRRR